MPRATLKLKSNEALVALSERHPDTEFVVRGAWPSSGKLRVLIETSAALLKPYHLDIFIAETAVSWS
jgi:hypothetical protein